MWPRSGSEQSTLLPHEPPPNPIMGKGTVSGDKRREGFRGAEELVHLKK